MLKTGRKSGLRDLMALGQAGRGGFGRAVAAGQNEFVPDGDGQRTARQLMCPCRVNHHSVPMLRITTQ